MSSGGVLARAIGRAAFWKCAQVGSLPLAFGWPHIESHGRIEIGDGFRIDSRIAQSHLVAGSRGLLRIGDAVHLSYGTGIAAHLEVQIGDRVSIGPYTLVLDTDFHGLKDRDQVPPGAPIDLGEGVRLGARVTVLKGVRIGARTIVASGSVVVRGLPEGVLAEGTPARAVRPLTEAELRGELIAL